MFLHPRRLGPLTPHPTGPSLISGPARISPLGLSSRGGLCPSHTPRPKGDHLEDSDQAWTFRLGVQHGGRAGVGRKGGPSRLEPSTVCVPWSGVWPPSVGLCSYITRFPATLGRGLPLPRPDMGCDRCLPPHRGCHWELAKKKSLLPAPPCQRGAD